MQLIPTPKKITCNDSKIVYRPIITGNNDYHHAIHAFCTYAAALGIAFTVEERGDLQIITDPSLSSGFYRLTVECRGITITASDSLGVHHAFASILQAMEPAEEAEAGAFSLPICDITDGPDSSYRGMMVDLARGWHDFPYLLSYVDMCYFYKVNYLQLHFTDDQSYTLPSHRFPALSTEGRHYTEQQIATLVSYANERGVSLIPEIDVPGHCAAFQSAYPEIFGQSGILCLHPDSIQAMQELFGELCDMFPHSQYIHIGGDEAKLENWLSCERCLAYARSVGIDTDQEDRRLLTEQMYAHFISTMADAVFAKGRHPIVWEGFSKEISDRISKKIIVMSWENYYMLTPELLQAGYTIINCAWRPMYIVTGAISWSPEEVFRWSIYYWNAVHPQSPYKDTGIQVEPCHQILGGQLLAWGDTITTAFPSVAHGVCEERNLLRDRLPCLAENTWNVEKRYDFEQLAPTIQKLSLRLQKILDEHTGSLTSALGTPEQ